MKGIVEMKTASIIVPVYNTEEYLHRCLDSLVNQTYPHVQIILVDDGSCDKSLEICQQYAQKYEFIEVYHQENRGVSAARNEGLKHIKGDFLFFVDSDDYVLPMYIEHFMNEEGPFIGGGYCENPVDGWRLQFQNLEIGMDEYIADCAEWFAKVPSVHVIGNRYSCSIVQEHAICFDENSGCGEDIRFNVNYFMCIDRLKVVDRCEYVYCIRSDSALHKFIPERLREEREECQARERLFGKFPYFQMIRYIHWSIALDHYYQYIKDEENAAAAKKQLRKTERDPYFRKAIPYAWRCGTKDMKAAALCLKVFCSYRLYRFIWAYVAAWKKKSVKE